ncbi:cell wall-binding repeat-containing protein [Neobacillus pocheonensis]|uniref:cell wall-binding repeat-containing protein n=1 Tax=Neobacillus pocheonensis TaxID=363869 RepID=UPI003D277F1F
MNNRIKVLLFVVMFFVVCHPNHSYAGSIADLPDRIDGSDRFMVATNISNKWGKADTVVIANYLAFADALTATPLAYKLNAPILLTHADHLTDETKKQMQSLEVKNVVIVGGEGSISEKVVSDISSLGISNITRISGKDRFEVSKNIAAQIGINETAVFANGLVFADALAIAPYASTNSYPILLTKNNELPVEITDLLNTSTIKKSLVIGGEGSVSPSVFSQLPEPTRIGGRDRYEVAANVANAFGQNRSKNYLATGLTFADALTGSVLAAKENAVILLTNSDRLPDSTLSVIKSKDVPVTILGGVGSVKDNIVQTLTTIKPSSRPILYIVPHQDDEILTFGVDIRNELSRGRQVHLILLTRGEDSGARNILNGEVYCWIHDKFHDPVKEGYKAGTLTPDEFADARTDEYLRASKALGVPESNIHMQFIPNGQFYSSAIRKVIDQYLAAYPNADVRTMSWFDEHSAHALIGRTVQDMQAEGVLQRYQAKYLVSINTDRFYKTPKPMVTIMNRLGNSNDVQYLRNAINEYKRFDPKNGYYAVGYHSVQVQFDSLWNDPYVNSHY